MSLASRSLGSTGLTISRVGLGNWAIGGPRGEWGWGAQDDDASIATILSAVERGITWIDTAAAYGVGHAEEVLARALHQLPEDDRPLVFTKCGLEWDGAATRRVGDPGSLKAELDRTRARLGMETLDLYQLHWPPEDGTDIRDSWAALVSMRDAGHIRFAGVSNVDAVQLSGLEGIGHVDVVQPPLSLLRRDAVDALIPAAAAAGTGTIVYSPLQTGLLTGKYERDAVGRFEEGDWRLGDPRFREPMLGAALDLVEGLRAVAEDGGTTLPELAIAWVLAQPGVSGAIVGARAPEQLDDWIDAGERTLDAQTLARIDRLLDATGAGTGPARSADPAA